MDESTIFHEALELPAGPLRERFLTEACGEEGAVRERIDALLLAHENPDSFLDNPAERVIGHELGETILVEVECEGKQIGPYKLLQQIGEGGMGVVFLAEQTAPIERRVALKIIKPGLDTREVIARFEAERQALALMDHPNIARVLDAGTTEHGRPYFVMELVNGVPLTQYCDENSLATSERLRLFSAICRAVQHAHQKGIIHRDLKPGNILVANYDDEIVPKVIDFGVARATNQKLTAKTLFTQFGQVVGTLEYMSPEQAQRNQLDVDTRSDVYSLGIVLYELLTGETPLDKERLRHSAFDEVLRLIREQEPALPSLKISESKQLQAVAATRRVAPSQLTSLVRGDLDWIVLKTLQKDRSERYASVKELADDILRHLQDLPIQAGPPRLDVRLRKFVKRNRPAVLASAAAMLLLVTAATIFIASRQIAAHKVAERSQRTSEAIDAASLALGRAVNSRIGHQAEWQVLDGALRRVNDLLKDGEVANDVHDRAATLLAKTRDARTERDIATRLENVLITSASHPDRLSWRRLERELAAILADNGFDLASDDPMTIAEGMRAHRLAVRMADILDLWIAARAYVGGPDGSQQALEPWTRAIFIADDDPLRTGIRQIIYAAKPVSRQEVRELTKEIDIERLPPRTLTWLGAVYDMAEMDAEADELLAEAQNRHPFNVMLNFELGYRLAHQKRFHEATRIYSRALALRPDAAGIWQMMGLALERLGEFDNARHAYERACVLESDYAPTWVNLGNVLLAQKDFEAAVNAGDRAIELRPDHPSGYGIKGRAFMFAKQYQQALILLEKCDEVRSNHRAWQKPSKQWIAECKRLLRDASSADNNVEKRPP